MSRFQTWLCLSVGALFGYWVNWLTLNDLSAAMYFTAWALFVHWLSNKVAA